MSYQREVKQTRNAEFFKINGDMNTCFYEWENFVTCPTEINSKENNHTLII
jgi:hypothetical protein